MSISFANNGTQIPQPNILSGQNPASGNGPGVESAKNSEAEASEKDVQKAQKKPKAPKRQYDRPNVGILDVPNISRTPLADTYVRKQKEFPFTKYKINFSKGRTQGLKPHAFVSAGIVLAGIMQLFKGR